MWLVISRNLVDLDRVMQAFHFYSEMEENPVSRAQFEQNIYHKKKSIEFRKDMTPLLSGEISWDIDEAFSIIKDNIFHRLEGNPWKGPKKVKNKV